jgi:hypothetical protein
MINLLLGLLIVFLVIGALWFICKRLPFPTPVAEIVDMVFMVICVIVLIVFLLRLMGVAPAFP